LAAVVEIDAINGHLSVDCIDDQGMRGVHGKEAARAAAADVLSWFTAAGVADAGVCWQASMPAAYPTAIGAIRHGCVL
jgi:hypothetical protein